MRAPLAFPLVSLVLLCACPVRFDDESPAAGIGGRASLTRSTVEPPGDACPYGGARVEHGIDRNGDGELSDDEVAGPPVFLCDGAPADDAQAMLVEVDDAPPSACPDGGKRVRVGWDSNGDASLSDDEVAEEAVVCDGGSGAEGQVGLVQVTPELPGANCAAGGQRVDVGLDADGDGLLTEGEIALTRFLCDGEDGPAGPDGSDAPLRLVRVLPEPPGDSCPMGGQRVETGVDLDGDGALSSGELEGVAYICDADAGGVVIGAGRVEGTAALPIPLELDAQERRLSSVAALSASYYSFTSAEGAAPYTLVVVGEDSPLALRLFDDVSLTSERALSCVREPPFLRCFTDELPAASTFVLEVREGAEVGNSFGLGVEIGRDLGDADTPRPLYEEDGTPLAGRVAVGRGGESTFGLYVPVAEAYTLSLSGLVSSDPDGLSWRIENDDGVYVRCSAASAPCATGHLEPGVSYRLIVIAEGRGAAFEVALEEGDFVTPTVPLDEVYTLEHLAKEAPRVFQFRTTTSSAYTLHSYAPGGTRWLSLYDAPPVLEGRDIGSILSEGTLEDYEAIWIYLDDGQSLDILTPERVYYGVIVESGSDTPTSPQLYFASRGGDEVDEPVVVGTPHEGSLVRESSYRFTTGASASRYSIVVDTTLPVQTAYADVSLIDVGTNGEVAALASPTLARQADPLTLVSPVLEAGREMELVIGSAAMAYTLRIEAGDTITTPLLLDAPTAISLPGDGVRYLAVDVTAPTPVALSVTGGHGRVMVSDTWPEATGDPNYASSSLFYCQGLACAGDLVLPPGRIFLSLENPLPFAQTLTLTLGEG